MYGIGSIVSYRKLNHSDHIYAIKQNGLIKIGKTKNITARMAHYRQLGEIEVIGIARVVDMHSEEKELLKKCGLPAKKREYYTDSETLRELLKTEFKLRSRYFI